MSKTAQPPLTAGLDGFVGEPLRRFLGRLRSHRNIDGVGPFYLDRAFVGINPAWLVMNGSLVHRG